MTSKLITEVKTRPLFYVFIIALCGTVAVASLYVENVYRYESKSVFAQLSGEVLREPWCGSDDFVLRGKIGGKMNKILVRGSGLSEECKKDVLDDGYVNLENVTLVRPRSEGNFHAFDYCEYLKAHGVSYYVYLKESDFAGKSQTGEAPVPHGFWYYSWKMREGVENTLEKYLSDAAGGWVMSIMTGDTGGLKTASKTFLSRSGFSHLVAVSGAHIAFLTKPVEAAVRRSLMRLGKRKAVALIPVLFLWYLAGGSASVTRATVTCAATAAGVMFKRRPDTLNLLGLAGIIQIASNPFSVFGSGFILSYACTVAIAVIMPIVKKKFRIKSRLLNGLLPGLAVNAGVLPLTMCMFGGFSPVGIVLNMFAAEIAGALCVGGYVVFLLDKIPHLKPLLKIGSNALVSLSYFLERGSSEIGGGKSLLFRIETPAPSISFCVIYYGVLAAVLLLLADKKATVPIAAVCITAAISFVNFGCKRVDVTFFDVGQGSAALIKTRDGVCGLVDTGTGSVKISELLKKEGVKELDFILISHGHNDHYGGFDEVVSEFLPKQIFVPKNEEDEYCAELKARFGEAVAPVDKEAVYELGKYTRMEMYEPEYSTSDLNNGSLMVRLYGKWGSILLPGDAETVEQTEIIDKGRDLSAGILCLGHHGSVTSGDESFIKAVNPEAVIISVGHDNPYGHPSEVVLERLKTLGVSEDKTYRTDRDGAVRIRLGLNMFGKEFKMIRRKRFNFY